MTDEQKRALSDYLINIAAGVPHSIGGREEANLALRRLVEKVVEWQERLENLNRMWTQDFRTKAARSKTYEQMEDDERQGHDDIIEKLRDFDPFKD